MRASGSAETRRREGRKRVLPSSSAIARSVLLILLPSLVLTPVVLVTVATPASGVPPAMTVSLSGPGEIVAGDDATYSFSASNTGATDGFNLGFFIDVPDGIEFVSSSLGTPVVYDATNPPPTPLPAGVSRWVWEDVADLPASGVYGGTVTVHAAQPVPPDATGTVETSDTDVFPVGSTYTLDGYAALSGDPTYLPVFNGSTGVGGPIAESETTEEGPSSPSTDVVPFQITKTEPSPEAELLRGVHDQTTVYSIQIRNTTQGPTQNTILVDYIPAGLEFLGCGGIDNSTVDRAMSDPTVNEYDNSPDLTGTPVIAIDCPAPISVDTVVADAAAATTYGVTIGETYTVVTWDLGTLAAGETRTVLYAAAIPLYENTIVWDGVGGSPTPASLGQAANLDNNNGPSTRHGDPAIHVDGDTWTNIANVFGDYYGIVRTGTDRASTDRDDQTVFAMDLSILKDITGGSATFEVNTTTEFTLTLRESEYMNSEDIVVTDTLPNGLCPLMPAGTLLTEHDGVVVTPECLAVGTVAGAEMVSVDAYGDGTFVIVFRPTSVAYPDPDDFILGENETHPIVFDALNRDEYELAPSVFGPTTSGDGFGNQVEFDATSFAVPDLTTWFPTPWFVWDDSGATIGSDLTTISKLVMPRDEVDVDLPPGTNPCTSGTYVVGPEIGFRMGDTVCFQLTVNFPTSIDVRNPVVTDFLPRGLAYEGHEISPLSTVPPGEIIEDASAAADGRLQWQLGHPNPGDPLPDLYVTRGQVLVIDLWATVVAPSSGPILDKPENLMKYRQQNVEGELYFLRDEAEMEIDPELELVKGVETVRDNGGSWSSTRPALSEGDPDGAVFASNRDGIEVREGEVVRYRVDLRTMPYPAEDAVVWDALAPDITAADVSNISDGGVAYDPGDPGYPAGIDPTLNTRSVVIWTGIDVPYVPAEGESQYTLNYDVTIPVGASVSTSYDNDASIIQYSAGINTSSTPDAQSYYPTDSFDVSLTGDWNTPGTYTRDDSNVYIAPATITKTVTSPLDTNNTATRAVKGEIIEFTYTVTIPAHTSVQNGVVSDALTLPARWTVHPDLVTVDYPGGSTAPGDLSFMIGAETFTVDTSTGQVTFPALYVNDTDSDQTFAVHLFVHVRGDANWNHSTTTRRNDTASFASDTQPTITAVSGIYVITPNPSITKVVSNDPVTAGQTVTYTLTILNNAANNRPTLYDTVVVDCVPAELTGVVLDAPSQGSAVFSPDPTCTGTRIVWDVGALLSGSGNSETLEYTATVSPASAGLAVYANPATITGYSLDEAVDRAEQSVTATETITVLGASLSKDVDFPTGTIGEERDYTISVTLPADVNFYDTALIDAIPAGMAISGVSLACAYGLGGNCLGDLPGGGVALTPSGTNQGWWLGDILSNPDTRTITLTYTGTVLDVVGNINGTALVDTADLRWSTTDLIVGPPADASYTPDVGTLPDDATVTVVEPDVAIAKLVNGVESDAFSPVGVAPGETFDYAVTATNEGTSIAYDVTVEDVVPTGVVVDAGTISDGGVLTGGDPITGGGTISWSLASLAVGVGSAHTFTYSAVLAPSTTLDGSALTNVVEVTGFASHPTSTPGFDDGELRTYTGPTADAVVTPDFPGPTIAKTPAAGPAYIGVPHSFTIVVTNDGTSLAQDVEVVDTLPADWVYDAGSTTVDGAPAGDPAIAGQDLTWSTLPDLDPDEFVTIVYTAHPDAGATWTDANTGADFDHTNDVTVTVDDASGSSANSVGPYTSSWSADVSIDRADIAIDKAHLGNPTAGSSFSWTVTVVNNGPDTSVGPFTVVDTLPADATYTGFVGTGWSDDTSVPGQVTFTHAGPLLNGDALPIITVNVTLPDDLAASTAFDNSATVTAETLDLDTANNTDDDPATTVVVADVGIDKASVGAPFTAGETITWDFVVTNNGPSIASGPFTVTDTLPATVDWGSVTTSGTGWACGSVTLAGELTCTWSTAALGVGASLPTLTIDATILPDTTGTVDNGVSVSHPTPDPEPGNDSDSTSDAVGTVADLYLTKTTVTLDIPANGTGRYRIEVGNAGPSDAVNVSVADVLPGGLAYAGNLVAAPGDTWTCVPDGGNPSNVGCTLDSNGGTLPLGGTSWFEFDVDADATVTGTVLNWATINSDTIDLYPPNNIDNSRTRPTLIVNKEVAPGTVERGSTITYTLNVESTSYGSTDDVTLTDPFPANLRVDSITVETSVDPTIPDWLSCDHTGADAQGYGGVLTCVLDGALERGRTTPNIVLVATVNPATVPGPLTNTATVAWTDPFDLGAGTFTAVSSVPLDVTLTGAELAASGIVGLSSKLALILVLVGLGFALVRFSRRLRTR